MRIIVTGCAGFIGSTIVDCLLGFGHEVVGIDDLSTGRSAFLSDANGNPAFEFVEGDLRDGSTVSSIINGTDAVVHLAANADVRFGWDNPRLDLEQNVVVTQNVLEAMRHSGVRRLLFSSTGSVYGETTTIPTPEDAPFPLQTSLYAASKVAAEGFISAYAEAGHIDASIFRFVSILGPRYTHGHVIDFVAKLTTDPGNLHVLGNGCQRKSYLHVDDCVSAMLSRLDDDPQIEVLNLGRDEYCTVNDSVAWIAERMGVEPDLTYSGGDRGWVGDNPFILLDTARMKSFGWEPAHGIRASVESTVDWLLAHPEMLDAAVTQHHPPAR